MYGPITDVGVNIKKWLTKWVYWWFLITVVHTMKKISESIKLKQKTVEKWILSQAIEDLLELYVSMSKDGVPEVVPKHTEVIYLAHGEDNQ